MITGMTADVDYFLHVPGSIDWPLWREGCQRHRLDPNSPVSMLPYGRERLANDRYIPRIGAETRRLYFYLAVQNGRLMDGLELARSAERWQEAPITRIISWGNCNAACPYCKRDCQFLDGNGHPVIAMDIPLPEVVALCEGAVARGEVVRFSGGDPVSFPKQTLAIAEYLYRRHEVRSSIAHNGSGPGLVRKLLPYLSSAAIDLKAVPEKIGSILGLVDKGVHAPGERFYRLSLETQALVSYAGVLLDVRTPVFGDTPLEDMLRLAHDIVGTNDLRHTFWTWRLYKAVQGCDWLVPDKDIVIDRMRHVSAQFPDLWMGVRAKWERGGMLYLKAGAVRRAAVDDISVDEIEFGSGNKLDRIDIVPVR